MNILTFYLLLFSFCLGQLGRFSIFRPDLVVHLNDLVLGITVFFYFFLKLLRKERISLPDFFKPMVAFLFAGVVSLLVNLGNFSLEDIVIGSLYLLRWGVYAMISLMVFNWVKKEKNRQEKILRFLVIAGVITAVLGIFQYLFFPDLRLFEEFDWDPHVYRVVGTFFDPGFIGGILVLNLILIFLVNKKSPFFLLSLFFNYLAMILTYSRTAYLAYLIAIFLISFLKQSRKFFILAILIFALTLQIIPKGKSYGTKLERQETFWARLKSWKTAILIFQKNPVFGVGFNNYRYAQIKYGYINNSEKTLKSHAASGSDNSFLFILATTGAVGFFAYLLIFVNLVKTLNLKRLFKGKEKNFFQQVFFVSLVTILTQSFFINSLFYPFIMEWFFILVGLKEAVMEKI